MEDFIYPNVGTMSFVINDEREMSLFTKVRKELHGRWYFIRVYERSSYKTGDEMMDQVKKFYSNVYIALILTKYSEVKNIYGQDLFEFDEDATPEEDRLKKMLDYGK